jgi:thiamine kinase-like enzyme
VGELGEAIASLTPALGALEGEPRPLSGGITNRNFRVALGGRDYVVRLHGAQTELLGIDREAERTANELAAALGIAPAVVAAPRGCLVTEFIACAPLDGETLAARVEEVGALLRRFHDCGAMLDVEFDVRALLHSYADVVQARGGSVPPEYAQAQAVAARIAQALPDAARRPCHNDLLAGNIICATGGERLLIVDWEYAGMGRASFDLGNLSVNNDFDADTDERLLTAYHGRAATAAERAELSLMRVLSDAREAAWGVVQTAISDLDFDFQQYARTHFERLREAVSNEDFEEHLAAASA